MPNNRRNFLKTTGMAATAGLLIKTTGWASANDTVRHACVGVNGRGQDHIGGFSRLKNVKIVALCDIDENVLNRQAERNKERLADPVKKFVDMREMLEDKEIDTVSIATPNHWHSLQSIWACQAGKDVYVEKPLSHNIREGRKLVEAAKKYDRIVQHGTQIRSSQAIQEAIKMLQDGIIGEVYYAKGTCYKWRDTIGKANPKQPPEGVHYDLWLGPAPEREFTENRLHYKWHWHWDYGNGDIGNQGVHQMDVARWGLGVGIPDVAQAMGGKFMFEDDQETPNTMVSTMKYNDENKMLVFEVRHWITNPELGGKAGDNVVGNLFLGSKGVMIMPSYTSYKVFLGKNMEPGPADNKGGDHYANFIDAVVKRDPSILNADAEEGHLSSALCHIANAAYLTEETLRFDRKTERCTNNEKADGMLEGTAEGYRTPYDLPENV